MSNVEYIVFDGIIGAGKSTLIQRLMKDSSKFSQLSIAHIDEPVDTWKQKGILQKSYANPEVWNFPAQCYFFHSRIQHIRSVVKRNDDVNQIFFGERSPFTDQLFWNVQLKEGRLGSNVVDANLLHETYMDMWQLWQELMPIQPTLFVYLRPSLDECMSRMTQRARECEISGVSMEYQKALLKEHDKIFSQSAVVFPGGKSIPILQIDTNDNFRDNDQCLEKIATQIQQRMKI
jgi:deoxyadenosine/deoxycytidine kinase